MNAMIMYMAAARLLLSAAPDREVAAWKDCRRHHP
jgi:hypothetical protein